MDVNFAVKIIAEAALKLIGNFEFLLHPAEGYVTLFNDTPTTVNVLTFDQDDAVRWIRYEERNISPNQAVQLTARGSRIHILVTANGCTYDCFKGVAYLFDGQNVYPKVEQTADRARLSRGIERSKGLRPA